MKKPEVLHTILLCVAATALAAALAFLYDKTEAVDLRQQNEILGFLRELREIDSRWDLDVVRARTETGATSTPAPSRAAAAAKALATLQAAVQRTPSAALSAGLPALSAAILEKASLVEKFRTEAGAAQAAFRNVLQATNDLRERAAALKSRAPALDLTLADLAASASLYSGLAQDAQRANLDAASAQLRTVPEGLREHAAQLENALQTLVKARSAEQALYTKLALMTSGPRLENLTFSFNTEIEATLQDKERYRVYLIAYAGALLILLAYVGGNLKAANLDL